MAQTLTTLIEKLEKAAIDIDNAPARRKIQKLVIDFRKLDAENQIEFFEIVPTGGGIDVSGVI